MEQKEKLAYNLSIWSKDLFIYFRVHECLSACVFVDHKCTVPEKVREDIISSGMD